MRSVPEIPEPIRSDSLEADKKELTGDRSHAGRQRTGRERQEEPRSSRGMKHAAKAESTENGKQRGYRATSGKTYKAETLRKSKDFTL